MNLIWLERERERAREESGWAKRPHRLAKCKRQRTEIIEDANISEAINHRTVGCAGGETRAGTLAHRVRRRVLDDDGWKLFPSDEHRARSFLAKSRISSSPREDIGATAAAERLKISNI